MRLFHHVARRNRYTLFLLLLVCLCGAKPSTYAASHQGVPIPFTVLVPPGGELSCRTPCHALIRDQATLQRVWIKQTFPLPVPQIDFHHNSVIVVGLNPSLCPPTFSVERIISSASGADVFVKERGLVPHTACPIRPTPDQAVEVPVVLHHVSFEFEIEEYGVCPEDLIPLCGLPASVHFEWYRIGGTCRRPKAVVVNYDVAHCFQPAELTVAEQRLGTQVHPAATITRLTHLPLLRVILFQYHQSDILLKHPYGIMYLFGTFPQTLRPVNESGDHPSLVVVFSAHAPGPPFDGFPHHYRQLAHIWTGQTFPATPWTGPWTYQTQMLGGRAHLEVYADCRRTCVDALGDAVQSLWNG